MFKFYIYSITKDLMLAMATGSKKHPAEGISGGDIRRMRVSTLRQKNNQRLMGLQGLTGMKNKQRLQWPTLRVYNWVE